MMGSSGSITTHVTNPVLFPFRSRKSRNNPVNPKRVPKFEARFFLYLLLHCLSEQTSLRLAVLMNKISNQKGLRKRSFEIIRMPDLENSSFLFNNVRVAYVATNPENGISFYANNGQGGVIGVSVYPDGRKVLKNATSKNNGNKYCHSKDDYLQFKNAFGNGKHILASHAVYMAWRITEIPAGMTIDHIDGCTTNNFIGNLRCISLAINSRDGGFLRKLRNQGINPGTSSRQTGGVASAEKGTCIPRWMLLRYFDRMAFIKEHITRWRYDHLDKSDLEILLFCASQVASVRFNRKYNLKIKF